MAEITLPTALSMKLKFPEFASVSDTTIEFAIEEASGQVTDAWRLKDQTLAVMYYAAHLVAAALAATSVNEGEGIASESIGPISISYQKPNYTADASDLESSPYGVRFEQMRSGNFPGVAIV